MNLSEFQQEIARSSEPVVVDFWAPWCAPCRMTKPVLEKLAGEYNTRIRFLPVNADESHQVAEEYRILGLPTVVTFLNGKEAGRVTGAQDEKNYRLLFEALAAGKVVRVPMRTFDRLLRLGGGAFFVIIGIATGNWLVIILGTLLAFLGIYDRCPVWSAITGLLKRR